MPALLFASSPVALLARVQANSQNLGLAWHLWGTVLIMAVLFAHLIGRGHYRLRITFWSQALDVTSGLPARFRLRFAADRLHLRRKPSTSPCSSAGCCLPPLVLSGRAVVRHQLCRAGLWQARALICGSESAKERAIKAMTADGSMGYVVAGSIDPHFDLTSRDPQ